MLYFLRHAQTDFNAAGRWMGLCDEPLNSDGEKQAKRVAKKLSDVTFSYLYVSPLARARQTAEIVLEEQFGSPEFIVDARLQERDFGDYEGKVKSDELRVLLESSPTVERRLHLCERLNSLMTEIVGINGDVLIVSHSAVFRALVVNMGYQTVSGVESLGNAEYARFTIC